MEGEEAVIDPRDHLLVDVLWEQLTAGTVYFSPQG